MTKKTQRKLYNLYRYLGVVVAGLLIVLGVALFAKKPEENKPPIVVPDVSKTSEDIIETTSGASMEESSTQSAVSAIDAVNVDRLLERYYTAKLSNDADTLNKIVEKEKPYTVADLADETQFIENYSDFTTYVLPGITENYFVVYVKYNIYFNGINTGAPALNHFICVKDEEGYYYIYDKNISGEFTAYLEETEKSDIVLKLKDQVEMELSQACASDTDLFYLIQLLNGTTETK